MTLRIKSNFLSGFSLFLLLLPSLVKAQSDPYVVSIRMMEQLVNLQQDARNLDRMVDKALYLSYNTELINRYTERKNQAEAILDNLREMSTQYERLIEKNPSEALFHQNIIAISLTALHVLSQKDDYYSYLKTVNKTFNRQFFTEVGSGAFRAYESDFAETYKSTALKWTQLETYFMTTANRSVEKLSRNKHSSPEFNVNKLIFLSYKNKDRVQLMSQAEKQMADFQSMADTLRTAEVAQGIDVLRSWMSQWQQQAGKDSVASELLRQLITSDAPEVSIWAKNRIETGERSKREQIDTRLVTIEIPEARNFMTWHTLRMTRYNNLKRQQEDCLELLETDTLCTANPLVLKKLAFDAFDRLTLLEFDIWENCASKVQSKVGAAYPDMVSMMKVINSLNKGVDKENLRMFANYLTAAHRLVFQLRYTLQGLNLLIKSNPDIAYYRLLRYKTISALLYLEKHAPDFCNMLQYYKTEDKINPELIVKIRTDFENTGLDPLIQADEAWFTARNRKDMLHALAQIERALLLETPDKALLLLTQLESIVPENCLIQGEIDPKVLINLYRCQAFLRMRNTREAKKQLQVIGIYNYTSLWIKKLNLQLRVIENEQAAQYLAQ